MNKTKIGIFLSLLLLIGLTSCGEKKSNSKLVPVSYTHLDKTSNRTSEDAVKLFCHSVVVRQTPVKT